MPANRLVTDLIRRAVGQPQLASGIGQVQTDLLALNRTIEKLDLVSHLAAVESHELGERAKRLGRLLTPRKAEGASKRRYGSIHDGGYVMLDDVSGLKAALSFGVGDNASWDADVAAEGVLVHQYDHTIAAPPIVDERIAFHAQKIVPSPRPDGASLQSILSELHVTAPASAILKIDIEGDEWPIFDAASGSELTLLGQIVCEFHFFDRIADEETFALYDRVLRKLHTYFEPIHVHANNYSPMLLLGGVPFPNVLEVTYANRSKYRFVDTAETFPTALDSPNRHGVADYYLGRFDFS